MERDQALKFIDDLLLLARSRSGTALFLTAGYPPAIKVGGKIIKVSQQSLTSHHTLALARAVMSDKQAGEFEAAKVCNFAVSSASFGRYRVNTFFQRGHVALVFCAVPQVLPTIDGLPLPRVLKDVSLTIRGIVIVVGATGSGKSTSLAAMIDWRNQKSYGHILTIEDPIEFDHPHKNCIVTQRELGVDVDSWGEALRSALRQEPDAILIGEIRDRATLEYAVAVADTGHLCMATLSASSAIDALSRLVNFYPEERRQQAQIDLALNLKAVISQRLLTRQNGKGRIAAVEILLNTPPISDLISKGDFAAINEVVKRSRNLGMQTLDQATFDLYEMNHVAYEDALRNANSLNDMRLQIKLNSQRARTQDLAAGTEHFHIDGGSPESRKVSVPGGQEAPHADPQAIPVEHSAVLLGASAPQAVCPGDEFTARLVAYVPELEGSVLEILRKLSPRSTSHMALKPCRWQIGAEFVVHLRSNDLEIGHSTQVATWSGTYVLVEFDVTVPATASERTSVLRFDISIGGITVALLRLDISVKAENTVKATVEARGEASRTAFASYSREDRQRVLDRVASARISAGLDIFLDCMSLHPGEEWKPRLEREIIDRDLFLLFWSKQSARSDWVGWEWKTAYAHKGRGAIQIHPLERDVKPPEELKDLHFDDPMMRIRELQPDASQTSS